MIALPTNRRRSPGEGGTSRAATALASSGPRRAPNRGPSRQQDVGGEEHLFGRPHVWRHEQQHGIAVTRSPGSWWTTICAFGPELARDVDEAEPGDGCRSAGEPSPCGISIRRKMRFRPIRTRPARGMRRSSTTGGMRHEPRRTAIESAVRSKPGVRSDSGRTQWVACGRTCLSPSPRFDKREWSTDVRKERSTHDARRWIPRTADRSRQWAAPSEGRAVTPSRLGCQPDQCCMSRFSAPGSHDQRMQPAPSARGCRQGAAGECERQKADWVTAVDQQPKQPLHTGGRGARSRVALTNGPFRQSRRRTPRCRVAE